MWPDAMVVAVEVKVGGSVVDPSRFVPAAGARALEVGAVLSLVVGVAAGVVALWL